jgi:hypothetical protein
MNLSNHSPDPIEAGLAVYVMQVTNRGQTGQCVEMPSQYAIRGGGCLYEVTCHETAHGESLVRLEVCEGDCGQAPAADGKAVVLHFSGGHLHGRSLRSDSRDLVEAILATAYFGLTRQGSKSERVVVLPAAWRQLQSNGPEIDRAAEYRVVDRHEDERTISVQLAYLPQPG